MEQKEEEITFRDYAERKGLTKLQTRAYQIYRTNEAEVEAALFFGSEIDNLPKLTKTVISVVRRIPQDERLIKDAIAGSKNFYDHYH